MLMGGLVLSTGMALAQTTVTGNTATDKVTVSGKCGHNTYTTVSGTVTDAISFTYSRSDQPGYHYRVTEFKSTGWAEDNK